MFEQIALVSVVVWGLVGNQCDINYQAVTLLQSSVVFVLANAEFLLYNRMQVFGHLSSEYGFIYKEKV